MNDTPDTIALRLMYETPTPDALEAWAARLSEAGVTIHHASPRGLDVEGDRKVLEGVLHITIIPEADHPRILPDPQAQEADDLAAPMIYAPRKPTLF